MWVMLKKTYIGLLGFFPDGCKYDLPEKTIADLRKELGKENIIDVVAPQEEYTDKKAVASSEAISNAKTAIANVERMKAEMAELRKVAARINTLKTEIDDGIEKAKWLAKQAGIGWPKK